MLVWLRLVCSCWRRLCGGYELKVFDRGNSYSPPEIKAPTLQLLMPPWRLVPKNQWSLLPCLIFVSRANNVRETRTTELCRVEDRLGEWYASKRIPKESRYNLGLAWNGTTSLQRWGRYGVHCAVHLSRASCAKNIQFISDLSNVIGTSWDFWRNFLWVQSTATARWGNLGIVIWRLCIINNELGPKKIWPEMKRTDPGKQTKRCNV